MRHAATRLALAAIAAGALAAAADAATLSGVVTDRRGQPIEFANVTDSHTIELVVWERGVGRTLACGTGAAATVVAAAVTDRVPFDEEVEVKLPGGPLRIVVQRAGLAVKLRGPARRVFSGEVAGW